MPQTGLHNCTGYNENGTIYRFYETCQSMPIISAYAIVYGISTDVVILIRCRVTLELIASNSTFKCGVTGKSVLLRVAKTG